MPPPHVILTSLAAIANGWRPLAIAWHLYGTMMLVALALRWRPSQRVVGAMLVPPLISVSALAWTTANPFTGIVFAAAALVLAIAIVRFPARSVDVGSPLVIATGAALVVTGWTYPHFLIADRWIEYAYAAPLGVVPCPTLCAEVGVALIAGLARTSLWAAVLGSLAIVYGLIGVLRLGVALDVVLLAAAAVLFSAAIRLRRPLPVI